MTIAEKRERLHGYCDRIGCSECILRGEEYGWKKPCEEIPCLDIDQSSEDDIDKAMALVYREEAKEFLEKKLNLPDDPVNHPSHYTDGKIEVIDFITDKKLGFCLGNAVKYIARAGKKDPSKTVEDLEKAIWYIKHHIKTLEEG